MRRRLWSTLAAVFALKCLLQEIPALNNIQTLGRALQPVAQEATTSTDLHSSHLAALPLQQWEEQSLRGLYHAAEADLQEEKKRFALDSCHPPSGVPPQCCLGTFAGMGRIVHNQRHQCARAPTLQQMQHLREEPFPGDGGCHVCHLLDFLRQRNRTMAFVGDSMSHQIFQGLVCEFYRRKYKVQETNVHFPTRQVARSNRGARTETIVSSCTGINHCIHLVRTIEVSSPQWEETNQQQSVKFTFFHIYRLPFADPKEEEWVTSSADILVVNFGLHWGANYNGLVDAAAHPPEAQAGLTSPHNPPNPAHLRSVLAEFLTRVARRGRVRRVLFRETSAQHFDADGGDYSFVKHKASKRIKAESDVPPGMIRSDRLERPPLKCVPHQAGNTSGWRERVVIEAAQQAKYSMDDGTSMQLMSHPTLTILPFFQHTKELNHLHPFAERSNKNGGGGGEDCTHFCSSPFLYVPLWKSIHEAMQTGARKL